MKSVDGFLYKDTDTVPDLGSWNCTESAVAPVCGKLIRSYYGVSTDALKLPTHSTNSNYSSLGTGSSAFCIDTGDLLFYNEASDSWSASS